MLKFGLFFVILLMKVKRKGEKSSMRMEKTSIRTNECDFHLTINYEIKIAEGDIPLDGLQTVIYELS